MTQGRNLALAAAAAAAITVGFSAPALADYVRLGSVDVGFHTDRDTAWSRFGGRVEGLRLEAGRSDIYCRSIRVTYANGERDRVFSGRLEERNPVYVDIRRGRIQEIDFVCRSDEFSGGKIYIAADVGRYRDEWRSSPDWSGFWSGVLGGGFGDGRGYGDGDRHPGFGGGFDDNEWVSLGRESFEGRGDTESHFTGAFRGQRGHSVDRIGLRALNADASCSRVTVTFGNGATRDLNISQVRRMDQGQLYSLDLPGGDRNITDITLSCHARRGADQVTIGLYARK
jgi:hypothetical protein